MKAGGPAGLAGCLVYKSRSWRLTHREDTASQAFVKRQKTIARMNARTPTQRAASGRARNEGHRESHLIESGFSWTESG